jgi:hypothetical protein
MKEINLVEILKDCPEGTKLYSLIYGDVVLEGVFCGLHYPIVTRGVIGGQQYAFTHEGCYMRLVGECILFPSKDNRDWTTFKAPKKKIERFDPNTLKPYDKVLGRDNRNFMWEATFFSHIDEESRYPLRTVSSGYKQLIPFKGNEHLLGKCGEPDEYYRYWEDKDGQTAST